MNPFVKKYSPEELEHCQLIRLIIATSGINNPKGDYLIEHNVCDKCKSGREFNESIQIPENSMGKKRIDMNFRYGYIVVEKSLIDEFESNGLTGFKHIPIQMGRDKTTYRQFILNYQLPQMSNKSSIHIDGLCEKCKRSGHYDHYSKETRFKYNINDLISLDSDFYKTWEYFGIWDKGQNHQLIIISQKAYRFLRELKLRHLKFEPIDIIN